MARSSSADPLEKFRFILSWNTDSETSGVGRAGFFEVGMPKRSTNKISYREGHDPDINTLSAGLSTMEDLTLTRGLIKLETGQEANNAFYLWMSAVHKPGSTDAISRSAGTTDARLRAEAYRKDVTIQVLDRTGAVARTYKLYNAWPVNFVPGSDMNAGEDGDKMLESLTLAYEDFEEMLGTAPAAASGNLTATPTVE